MRINNLIASIVLLAGALSSCSDRPEGVAGDKKMVKIMADLEMAEAYSQTEGYTSKSSEKKEQIVNYILNKNDITREEFDSTLSWYGRNLDKYDELYKKVDRELAKRGRKINGSVEEEVTLDDLWPYSRHILISQMGTSDGLTFNIDASTENIKGDKVTWKVRTNSSSAGNMLLGVSYEGGECSYSNQSVSGKQTVELTIQTDTSRVVKRIYGNLRITDKSTLPLRLDSINLFTVPYDSTDYYRINNQRKYHGPKRKVIVKPTEEGDSIKSTPTVGTGKTLSSKPLIK